MGIGIIKRDFKSQKAGGCLIGAGVGGNFDNTKESRANAHIVPAKPNWLK